MSNEIRKYINKIINQPKYKGVGARSLMEGIAMNGQKFRQFRLIKENHDRIVELFEEYSINENNDKKKESVIEGIKNDDWEKHDPVRFKNALDKSKHKEMLTDYSISELNKMKLFKLTGYDIGYALKEKNNKYSEIVAVFNNEPDVKGIGRVLIESAIKNGGCYLDHFDGFLNSLYGSMGFVEYDRYNFDPQYDTDGKFREKYGEADVIFRKHKNCI
jgi:hypothetical protein